LLLLLEGIIKNNNIVLPRFTAFQTRLTATARSETSTRDVKEPQKYPLALEKSPKNKAA
jgi:hypothetical protein